MQKEVKELIINKLSEYPVISTEEQMMLKGGDFGWPPPNGSNSAGWLGALIGALGGLPSNSNNTAADGSTQHNQSGDNVNGTKFTLFDFSQKKEILRSYGFEIKVGQGIDSLKYNGKEYTFYMNGNSATISITPK